MEWSLSVASVSKRFSLILLAVCRIALVLENSNFAEFKSEDEVDVLERLLRRFLCESLWFFEAKVSSGGIRVFFGFGLEFRGMICCVALAAELRTVFVC